MISMANQKRTTYKIVMLGDGAVGKTSLIKQYITHTFSENYLATIGIQMSVKEYRIQNETIKVMFWDIAGQQAFSRVHPLYFQGADAAILVYDITRRTTFENVDFWYKRLMTYAPNAILILCGNKIDLANKRVVTRLEGQYKAKDFKMRYFVETSAKTGEGVDELFEILFELVQILTGNI